MRYSPPLAHHPRLAVLASVIIPFFMFGWVMPSITGEARNWPFVFVLSLIVALVSYLARTRSARFLGYAMIGISVAALTFYGWDTAVHGIPQARTGLITWGIVIAIPIVGLALGWWALHRPRSLK